ncbi:hypothetical protein [Pseudobacteriovorax antillogorgiicola]|uniref:Uncharacterized protein n=1 Tax=Pseudobacteriovorax antillogorgiicola TaxID=1513793 RepID=A0A1Y6CPW9_9BACT|nr:hypothetical protein [Pseudobacteriovorax antillogorgiicola]TCS42730.1 hypothetical protein EDD56_14117 [Pseudobacteriovorax antillogorgiicola]SMF82378.1 hypothetical protein SAMN06296036_1413 [Pseudobacteriovorax antillogorgiicola]
MKFIAKVILSASVIATSAQAATCLDQVKNQPASGYINVDDIYYELQDSRLPNWQELFAFKTVKALESRLGDESCEALNVTAEDFVCKAGEQIVCVAKDSDRNLSVAVVKDYVDSANVVVLESSQDARKFPLFQRENDFAELWLPNPNACYAGLLNNFSGDSAVHTVSVQDEKRWSDGRFVLAAGLRKVVEGLVAKYQESEDKTICNYEKLVLRADALSCRYFGYGVEACSIKGTQSGYFEIFKVAGSDKLSIVFNRFD